MKWYLSAVLICIYLVTNYDGHNFKYLLTTCSSSLEKRSQVVSSTGFGITSKVFKILGFLFGSVQIPDFIFDSHVHLGKLYVLSEP